MSEYKEVEVKEVQHEVERMLNTFSYQQRIEEFNNIMLQSHRSLQQTYTNLCLDWLQKLSVQSHYDLRNQASVEVATKIMKAIDNQVRLRMI